MTEGKEEIVHRFPVPRDDGSLKAHVFRYEIPPPSETNVRSGIHLSLVSSPTDEQLLNWQVELAAGQRLDYYIIIRNSAFAGPRDCLVTTFLDGYQLPISADGPEARVHLRLFEDQQAEVPASLLAPRQPGKYLFFPFAIINPYNLRRENPLAMNALWGSRNLHECTRS